MGRIACLLCVGGLLFGAALPADELRVAVAGNFAAPLERLTPDFEGRTGHRLAFSVGSTGKLYAQIVQGAPFDVFLAADRARPERLEAGGRIVPGTRATYALGRLALWSPAANSEAGLLARLRAEPPPRLAIANPRLAPFGAAAREWLEREGLWARLGPGAVRGENVAQAFHFVASGNAELGLVALGQMRARNDTPIGVAWIVPAARHAPIEQQVVLLRDSVAGRAFLDWLGSEPVRSRLQELGYDSP